MGEEEPAPPTRDDLLKAFSGKNRRLPMCCTPKFKWIDDALELWADGQGSGWSVRAISIHAKKLGFQISRFTITTHLVEHRPELWDKIKSREPSAKGGGDGA